jgi:hypothetical protein
MVLWKTLPDRHWLWPSIRTTFASYFNWTVFLFCASFRQGLVCGCFLLLEPSLIRDHVVGDLHYIKDYYFCNETFTFFSVHMSPECWHTKFSHSMLIITLINEIHNKMPWLSDLSQMLIYWNSEKFQLRDARKPSTVFQYENESAEFLS